MKHRVHITVLLVIASQLAVARPLHAGPSQQDVFKSIQQSVGEKSDFDSRPVLLLGAGGAAMLLLLATMGRRNQKPGKPDGVNHSGKLMKEVLRALPLKSGEVKQLKILTEAIRAQSGEDLSPLTLLLCPSLIARGLRAAPPKLDRQQLVQVVRKLKNNAA